MNSRYTLIIAEKPRASQRIAEALAEGNVKISVNNGVKFYEFQRNGKKHVCVSAVGHLFTLETYGVDRWAYPVFKAKWIPSYVKRNYRFTKPYYDLIRSLAEEAGEIIIATDYDIEGEVIGYNILRFICNEANVRRMVFSTLTRRELVESYKKALNGVDNGLALAGLTRHYLDFYWGINLTRALTSSMNGRMRGFKLISSGRVQSPMLHILYVREKEIEKFKPKPFWMIKAHCKLGERIYVADFEEKRIWNRGRAEEVYTRCSGRDAVVSDIKQRTYKISPPTPFNSTRLQSEAFNQFGLTPRQTMAIAEELYQEGLISYPRTSSEKIPERIDLKAILRGLSGNREYKRYVLEIISSKKIRPREGKKTDPAHPAIHPTGEKPKGLNPRQRKIYDLIVRRFLACFMDECVRESREINLVVSDHKFILKGFETVSPGWTDVYSPYVSLKEDLIPPLNVGEKVKIVKIEVLEDATKPPRRYTPASIIKEIEARGLGTKSTRDQILQILYDRGYIKGKNIQVTSLGKGVIEALEKFCPQILSEKLTMHFEREMENVRTMKKRMEDVLAEAQVVLTDLLNEFKQVSDKIGQEMVNSFIKYRREIRVVGECPVCGGELLVIKSKRTGKRFVGCSNYGKGCKFSAPLPQRGTVTPLGTKCKVCGYPMIKVNLKGRRPFTSCINLKCPKKSRNR